MLKKQAKLLLSIVIVLALCIDPIISSTAKAETLVTHYIQPFISDPSTCFFAEGQANRASNQTLCFAYGLGSNVYSQNISWNISDFTGFAVPNPISNYQKGIDNTWYGASSSQVYGNGMAFQCHKESGEDANPAGWIYGMQVLHDWSTDLSIRPWKGYGANAKMRLQTYYGTSGSYRTGDTVQYGQMFVNLVDTVNHHNIWYVVSLWDSRGVQHESVARDTVITSNFVVNTHLTFNMRYCERPDWSHQSNKTTDEVFYCAYVSRQNLINAITDINNTFGEDLSTNPDDYAVNVIGNGVEMYSPAGSNGWIAGRQHELALYTEY